MTEFLPTRRALIAAAILSVVVAMLFLATRAATGLDTVPTDLPNIVEPAGQAHGSDVPAIPNVEPIPTTTTVPATESTFSERLQDRAESGGGEYLPAPTIGLDLDAPATTVAEAVANVVESTTTTGPVETTTTIGDGTADTDLRADYDHGRAILPACQHENQSGCYWSAGEHGNGNGYDFVSLPDGRVILGEWHGVDADGNVQGEQSWTVAD